MHDRPSQELNSGSRWHRWEPHVHAPGTILNDQFKGADSWEGYLNALESATPAIGAIGITDYYSTETYERVCEATQQGRLPCCNLIFPNIEMRLGIGTIKGRWVNIHLLVSPEDPSHLTELKRILARLNFSAHDDSFCCSRDDLIRLGQQFDPSLTDPIAALKCGSEQFKVSFDQLRQVYNESAWAQQNILIAVAGSETDGTSGVRDAADATLRQELEKFAHVIFASSVAQREFWLGRRSSTEDELWQRYGGPKPCMHGSDAHEPRTVGVPDQNRYSWIKGALEFDTLRQACIDPAGRAFVGAVSPVAKWLYSTEHIAIHYSIDYDGVDIRKLSPGTRGIVLLLLYLALDDADDRPLIIDQPEESLDPKSVFDELVSLFLDAKNKRQVIMVTHNANLVVNTDADQIIVAHAGPHPPGELPPISYLSGGLESAHIRKAVCDILEGGERAFQERARRLRVRLER
jgi:hypothetical protein